MTTRSGSRHATTLRPPRVVVPEIARAPLAPSGAVASCGGATMGTTWSVRFVADDALDRSALAADVAASLDLVVGQMSPWSDASDLSAYHRAAPGADVALPEPFFSVLEYALSVARDSGGAYDPTVGPLVDLWGFGPPGPREAPPPDADVHALRPHVGWNRVALDRAARTARQPGGLRLDLSAVAKGYAVDRVASRLRAHGVRDFLVEVGGELRGEGVKPDGQPWWVAIERPPGDGAHETRVALHGLSIATSGDSRRFFEHAGRRYAHTVDPRSGRPVAHAVASVTVLHRACMAADAWSTALYVMGVDDGLACASARGLAALFVRRVDGGFQEVESPAFAAMAG